MLHLNNFITPILAISIGYGDFCTSCLSSCLSGLYKVSSSSCLLVFVQAELQLTGDSNLIFQKKLLEKLFSVLKAGEQNNISQIPIQVSVRLTTVQWRVSSASSTCQESTHHPLLPDQLPDLSRALRRHPINDMSALKEKTTTANRRSGFISQTTFGP